MKKKKIKLTKKQSQRIKTLVLTTGLLICCCIVFTLIFALNIFGTSIYKVDSRVRNIAKEQKNEKDNTGYETIGWLKVQGTKIDAPIIGYEYVTDLAHVEKDDYLWNNNNKEKLFNQVVISGHNIMNLSNTPKIGEKYFSRFDDLMAFVYEDFINDNKYIQYTVNEEDHVYKIFGVFFEKDYKLDLNHKENYTKEETKDYIKQINESSIYDFDVEVDENDSLITLTTCTRIFGKNNQKQFVVVGRLLRENEKMDNYKVTANDKYKEIKKLMEGDDDNAQA
ncbi:MAG: class B sortase [Bacilli bacterium]|nr:class B sortase [Bacilli bacterium]